MMRPPLKLYKYCKSFSIIYRIIYRIHSVGKAVMKRKKPGVAFFIAMFACIVMFCPELFADGQRIVSIDNQVIDLIRHLYNEQQLAPPSLSGPWSVNELRAMLTRLDTNRLSPYSKITFERVQAELQRETHSNSRSKTSSFSVTAAFESYVHSDPDNFNTESDWDWDHQKRSPMLLLEADLAIARHFYLSTNLAMKNNRFALDPAQAGAPPSESPVFAPIWSTNVLKLGDQDFDTPDRAFIAAGGAGFSFQFGRDRISWGPGTSGNLILGSQHKYQEFFRFTWYGERFKFTSATLFFDPYEWTARDRLPYVPARAGEATVRMFLAHRFEFRPVSWLSWEVSENVMYEDTTFNFKYLNPAFIFHNLSNRGLFNAIADMTVQAALTPGVTAYGTIAIDQIRAPGEGSDQPNAMGYLFGLNIHKPLRSGAWDITLEAVLTEPYLYMRDGIEHKVMTRERDQDYGYVPHYEYLGYRHGGDAVVGLFDCSYTSLSGYSIGGRLTYLAHGEIDIATVIPFGEYPEATTPSGTAVHKVRYGLYGLYSLPVEPLFRSFEMWLSLDAVRTWGRDQHPAHDVQLVTGISLSY